MKIPFRFPTALIPDIIEFYKLDVDPLSLSDKLVMGDKLTMVDCALGMHVHRYYTLVEDKPALKNIDGWYERLKGRPAFVEHIIPFP